MLYQPPITGDNCYFLDVRIGQQSRFQTHWHYEMEVIYCINGNFCVQIEQTVYNVCKGEFIIINSTEDHNFKPLSNDTSILLIEFGSALLGSGFNEIAYRSFKTINCNNNIINLFENILLEYNKNSSDSKWLIKAYIYETAALIFRNITSTAKHVDEYEKKLKYIMVIKPVLDYVAKSYDTQITLDNAADLTHYEKKSFCRTFKSTTGMTFHQYLNSYRIEQACLIINTEHCTINQVSKRCGINHAKTFSRLFRQYTGMSPTEYKNI